MRLHRYFRADQVQSEQRARRGRWGRWVYLAVILVFFGWLAQLFFGPVLYFRVEGMVLANVTTVATEFSATVQDLVPKEGDRVTAGQIVAEVKSQEVTERMARVASSLAELQSRYSALQIRTQVVARLLEVSKGRATATAEAIAAYDKLHEDQRLLTRDRLSAYEADYRSQLDVESLKAEQQANSRETHFLLERMNEATEILEQLKKLYAAGELRAPITGVVGRLYVAKGAVVRLGEPIMDIYDDHRFILAYVPAGAVYEVLPGDPVMIRYGLDESHGVIERVEPVALQLPKEFQRTFKPVDRARVLRISIQDGHDLPPLFSKITVSAGDWPPNWLLRIVPWFKLLTSPTPAQ